ncbi:MAG TPA: ABC transporter permease, partial [Alicycliphilus sp.]|nr:ABC transporter permease [Alicycliphilus sp.]
MSPRQRLLLAGCALPAGLFFLAFWLLPALQLLVLPAKQGWQTYFVVLTDGRYIESMLNTVVLSAVVTVATLVIGAAIGIYLARRSFVGKRLLLALLTLPLSFPGVIIGFFVILLGGRQGLVADLSSRLVGARVTFAYG